MGRLSDAFVLGSYPDAPGFKERGGASQEAAASLPRAGKTRADVLAIIAAQPSTADEVAENLGLSVLYIRPRVSELRAEGLIEEAPVRRRANTSGRSATVWRVRHVEEG